MSHPTWTLRQLAPTEALRRADEIADIYQRAFGYDGRQRAVFRDRYLVNVGRYEGALLLAAERGTAFAAPEPDVPAVQGEQDGQDVAATAASATASDAPLLGFLYGYDFRRAHWWPQMIAPALENAGHGEWMADAFELAELEVDPLEQGRGIGTALITRLMAQVGHRHILLSTTADPEDRAKVLYRRMGFVDLLPGFRYGGVGQSANIMGWRRGS